MADYQKEVLALYREETTEGVEQTSGRRFITWRLVKNLEKPKTHIFMQKIRKSVNTAFYARHVYGNKIRNIEDGAVMTYFTNIGSPWFNRLEEAEKWLEDREEVRLNSDNIKRPDTKWGFEGFSLVDVKVVLDRQPLMGTGPLPDWLRKLARGRAGPMVSLDTYQDNLCLWRCIAVYQGARADRSTAAARLLAKSFFKFGKIQNDSPRTSLDELDDVEKHLNKGANFSDWIGIRFMSQSGGETTKWFGT